MKCSPHAIYIENTSFYAYFLYTEFTSAGKFVAKKDDRNLRQSGFPLSIDMMTNRLIFPA
jgi:hypothetical protein